MITELKQRNLFHSKHFKLYSDRLYYKNKTLFGSLELEIPFENLTNHVVYQKTSKPILWLFTAFFSVVFLAKSYYLFFDPDFDWILYLVVILLLAIFFIGAQQSQRNVMLIKVETPAFIEIYTNKPSDWTVTEFHGLLRATSKDYLLNKFVFAKGFSITQQKSNLAALQDKRIIDEIDTKMLTERIDSASHSIGFKIT